jgi:hypothetical protein
MELLRIIIVGVDITDQIVNRFSAFIGYGKKWVYTENSAPTVRFEVFMSVTMKNVVFLDVTPCGSCKNRVSEECKASIIRVTITSELGTTLAVTSNQCML